VQRLVASKWFLVAKVMPFVAAFLAAKLIVHTLDWEPIALGPVLTSLIAATVFLLGFLISGTLSDYKESERLPGEISAIFETMADDCRAIHETKGAPEARACMVYLRDLLDATLQWMAKEVRTNDMLDRVAGLSVQFAALEPYTQPNFIVRLRQEQNLLRRAIMRIDTIRDTEFVKAGYTIAQIATGLLILAFVLTNIDPFYESLFLFGAVTFLLLYILFLIEDLDNPFSYNQTFSGSRVSRKHLRDTLTRLDDDLREMGASKPDGRAPALATALT
jgi:ABC-type multidrug transport system fused ATPase/permease subunit